MASYLEAYGAAEQHRARVIGLLKKCSIALAGVLVAGLILYAIFKNHAEERQAKNFLGSLAAHNYSVAYTMWGCTEAHPCPQYTLSLIHIDVYKRQGFRIACPDRPTIRRQQHELDSCARLRAEDGREYEPEF